MAAPKQTQSAMHYAGLATQWMAMLGVSVWAGYKIDKWINWKFPLFLILFPLISLSVSLWQIIKDSSKTKK